jgi:hypothetical protein
MFETGLYLIARIIGRIIVTLLLYYVTHVPEKGERRFHEEDEI